MSESIQNNKNTQVRVIDNIPVYNLQYAFISLKVFRRKNFPILPGACLKNFAAAWSTITAAIRVIRSEVKL